MAIEIAPATEPEETKLSPLDALHRSLGGRMVPFAGWSLPVQYPGGIIAEHTHCRSQAALFDVSHMGQASLAGADAAAALERLTPADITGLRPGRQRYGLLTDEAGGILDDFMVANLGSRLMIVLNASRTGHDLAHLREYLPAGVTLTHHEDRALLALQGPAAASVLARFAPATASLPFMGVMETTLDGLAATISRSGYTGEDGFEMSIPAEGAEQFARHLLGQPEVKPAGLGARDSLRLEAGLPLYGHDIDELTTPVEAGLAWSIGKRRRLAWDFPGAAPIRDQLENGYLRVRVGLLPEGRAPARTGTAIAAADGVAIGTITSGGFSPTLGVPIAMGYVRRDLSADGTAVQLVVRNRVVPARVAPLPFVPHRYVR